MQTTQTTKNAALTQQFYTYALLFLNAIKDKSYINTNLKNKTFFGVTNNKAGLLFYLDIFILHFRVRKYTAVYFEQ